MSAAWKQLERRGKRQRAKEKLARPLRQSWPGSGETTALRAGPPRALDLREWVYFITAVFKFPLPACCGGALKLRRMCKDVKIRVKGFITAILCSEGQFSFLPSNIKTTCELRQRFGKNGRRQVNRLIKSDLCRLKQSSESLFVLVHSHHGNGHQSAFTSLKLCIFLHPTLQVSDRCNEKHSPLVSYAQRH